LNKEAAGGVLTAKQAPRRPGTAPALGLRAGRVVASMVQTASKKEITMLFRSVLDRFAVPPSGGSLRTSRPRTSRLAVEALEDRVTPTAMFSINDVSIVEGNTGTLNAVLGVTLSEPHGNSVTVNYNTANGSALAGSDYTAVSGTLTFAKNEMSKSIAVPIHGDRLIEADEYFSVRLSNSKGAKIADALGFVTILNDEPHISINDATLLEGDSDTASMTFNVSLGAVYNLPVTINYATSDGTATPGEDYVPASGTLTFQPGQKSQTIAIAVNGDRLTEQDETILVTLTTSSNVLIDKNAGVGTIRDNEPHVTISDPTLLEGDSGTSTMTFNVSFQAGYDLPVTISYATNGGTATPGDDYAPASGTLTFQPGQTLQTIVVAVNGDVLGEYNETILVNLTTSDSYVAMDKSVGVGIIRDNELHLSIDDAVQSYNAWSITFYVTLTAPSDEVVTVDFNTVNSTAWAGVDYVATSGTMTFNPGETWHTITVQLLTADPSADKHFGIQLSNPSSNVFLADGWAFGIWYYDDGSGW
jgi:Calx-beta domain-containing protein